MPEIKITEREALAYANELTRLNALALDKGMPLEFVMKARIVAAINVGLGVLPARQIGDYLRQCAADIDVESPAPGALQ